MTERLIEPSIQGTAYCMPCHILVDEVKFILLVTKFGGRRKATTRRAREKLVRRQPNQLGNSNRQERKHFLVKERITTMVRNCKSNLQW